MEGLVERLEKAVERLETVCQRPGMCGDASAKGEAQSSGRAVPAAVQSWQGTLWGSWGGEGKQSEAGSSSCAGTGAAVAALRR